MSTYNIITQKSKSNSVSEFELEDKELIYLDLINSLYSDSEIRLYFLIKYKIDISNPEYQFNKKRIGQQEFKQELINRYGKKCILSGADTFDACHIIPFSDSENMDPDNGLLLNPTHHRMFDNYEWSINPNTLQIEINYSIADQTNVFSHLLDGMKLKQLEQYIGVIKYLKSHYDKFKQIQNSDSKSN